MTTDIGELEALFDTPKKKVEIAEDTSRSYDDKLADFRAATTEDDSPESISELTQEMAKDDAPPGIIDDVPVVEEEPTPATEPETQTEAEEEPQHDLQWHIRALRFMQDERDCALADLKRVKDGGESWLLPDAEESKDAKEVKEVLQDTYKQTNPKPSIPGEDWMLESPANKFDKFYAEKAALLEKILVNGPIPFAKYRQELRDSSVDVSVGTFDTIEIYERMAAAQNYLDRVNQIQIDCNTQFFLWERGVELMQGLLARVQYDKPAARQEGVIYEHMHDMELYYGHLRGTSKSADAVAKNLESALGTLSRRVTIAMPGRPIDRYKPKEGSSSPPPQPSTPPPELKGFDGLQTEGRKQEKIEPEKTEKTSKGTTTVDWGQIK